MGADAELLSIRDAFALAQKPQQSQAKLVAALRRTYAQVSDGPGFQGRCMGSSGPAVTHEVPGRRPVPPAGGSWMGSLINTLGLRFLHS